MNVNKSRDSQTLFIVISVTLSLVISISFAEWVLSYQRQHISSSDSMEPGMVLYDAQLGWKLKPNWQGKHHHYDYNVSYNINYLGFRGGIKTTSTKVRTYNIIGDSYSFGIGVNDDETFSAHLNKSAHLHFNNLSVPGYSTDQQLLLLQQLDRLKAHDTLLVVYLGNDLFDNERGYPLQADHAKPYFSLSDQQLKLQNTPVPLIKKPAEARKNTLTNLVLGGEKSTSSANWFSRLEILSRLGIAQEYSVLTDTDMTTRFSSQLDLFMALITEMEKTLDANHAKLRVVLLPGPSYVLQPESLSHTYQDFFRHSIIERLKLNTNILSIDLASYLRESYKNVDGNLYYPNEGHLTPLGHKHVAEYLQSQLGKL